MTNRKLFGLYLTNRASDVALLQQKAHPHWCLLHGESLGSLSSALQAARMDFILTDVNNREIFLPEVFRQTAMAKNVPPVFILTRETDRFFLTMDGVKPAGVFHFPHEVDLIIESVHAFFSGPGVIKRPESSSVEPEGISDHAVSLRQKIRFAAESEKPVLLLGETGCGKERAANAIHAHSVRKFGPFCTRNSTVFSEHLVAAEFFGSLKGSFTDARDRKGIFEGSYGGTVFLDEIGDMDISLQPKLLRVLEEGKVYRLGSLNPIATDFRLICATNKNLSREVDDGNFREDLFYRINGIRIEIPPLRERPEDIFPIVSETLEKHEKFLSEEALDKLENYAWPGNIRELLDCISRAVQETKTEKILASEISFQ